MLGRAARALIIHGREIPRRRFTLWAALYFAGLVALPILLLSLALDGALYLWFTHGLGRCYGIFCLVL
jgi:hypothetical protein